MRLPPGWINATSYNDKAVWVRVFSNIEANVVVSVVRQRTCTNREARCELISSDPKVPMLRAATLKLLVVEWTTHRLTR